MTLTTLTTSNARSGMPIICTDHPDWGTATLGQDRNGWTRRSASGYAMMDPAEFHFWHVAPWYVRAEEFFKGLERVARLQLANGKGRADLLDGLDHASRGYLHDMIQRWARARRR